MITKSIDLFDMMHVSRVSGLGVLDVTTYPIKNFY